MLAIPKYVAAIDAETKGIQNNAFILSIAMTIFEVSSGTLVDSVYTIIDPLDPSQAERTTTESTLYWWSMAGYDPKFAPMQSYQETFSGNSTLKEALLKVEGLFQKYRFNLNDMPVSMKAPEFGYALLKSAIAHVGIERFPLIQRCLDSSRTVNRVGKMLGLAEAPIEQLRAISPNGRFYPHIAICDALEVGLNSARLYAFIGKLQQMDLSVPLADFNGK